MQAGQKSSGSVMVIDSDSASEDSDFSADEDSSDDGDDSDDSDVVLCAEYRPHVQARELGDKWEEEAKESKAAQGRGSLLLSYSLPVYHKESSDCY